MIVFLRRSGANRRFDALCINAPTGHTVDIVDAAPLLSLAARHFTCAFVFGLEPR